MKHNGIDRSTVNSEQYAAPEFQKSGFDLSYSRHSSYMLGRLHIGGFQHIMPGDKIYGASQFNGTFNRLIPAMITPVRAMSYQVFLPFRAVDTSFTRGMTPTKLNNMSNDWNVPTITTKDLVDKFLFLYGYVADVAVGEAIDNHDYLQRIWQTLISTLNSNYDESLSTIWENISAILDNDLPEGYTLNDVLYHQDYGIISNCVKSLTDSSLTESIAYEAKCMYLDDVLADVVAQLDARCGTIDNPIDDSIIFGEFMYNFFDCILTPFIGRYSYYAELKYNYLRPFDIYRFCYNVDGNFAVGSRDEFLGVFDDTPQCEYPLRINYAIWYELFRNVDLEPVGGSLPDWREFGSVSMFETNVCFTLYRPRNWEKDMFTSAQIDDISRHVFAPVAASSFTDISGHIEAENNLYTNNNGESAYSSFGGSKPALYVLKYQDQFDDTFKYVECPVPANVNDVLSSLDMTASEVFGLDLNTLRQSQMLERYLKRNYLFGDEYQDRLLAHYNARLSDLRINRPEILGRAINDYKMGQQVSNVSTEETKVGDRTATAEITCSGDNYSTYAEEFGMVITILTIMPRPMYDGICPQNLLYKMQDFPLPEFASNNEEFGRKMEIASTGLNSTIEGDSADKRFMFGRYPAYHAWRSRTDEVGGLFLNEMQDCTFRRFWGMYSENTTPKLNYYFIHCRPSLAMFADSLAYSTQVYGDMINECYVERVLPTPVEVI